MKLSTTKLCNITHLQDTRKSQNIFCYKLTVTYFLIMNSIVHQFRHFRSQFTYLYSLHCQFLHSDKHMPLCLFPENNRWHFWKNGILLLKLFWPTVRKNCSSDREKLLKFEAGGQEFSKSLRPLEQFIRTGNRMLF